MQAHAEIKPISSSWVQIKVPTIRIPHIPLILKRNGKTVLPIPYIIPSMMMDTP